MNKTIGVFVFAIITLLSVHLADAQQSGKVYRIGMLTLGYFLTANTEAFRQGLRDLGYVESRNLIIESRFAEGKLDRLPDLVAELIRLKVDLIVSNSTEAIQMIRDANRAMPVVMASISDPLGSGLVETLARPGGNITGLSLVSTELAGKRLELLKEVVPKVSRVALLVLRNHPPTRLLVPEMESAARALKITVQPVEIATPDEFKSAFAAITSARAGALFVQNNTVFGPNIKPLAELAAKHRLPAMGTLQAFVDAGGLMTYGPNVTDMWRRAATYVDKILKGTKPADIPVEQPMKFEFFINLKTAKALGLTIPYEVLMRADRVIK